MFTKQVENFTGRTIENGPYEALPYSVHLTIQTVVHGMK